MRVSYELRVGEPVEGESSPSLREVSDEAMTTQDMKHFHIEKVRYVKCFVGLGDSPS